MNDVGLAGLRSPGALAMQACILEVSAPKAGNVHRGADFDDATFVDFLLSAAAIAGPLDRARETGVGRGILACVDATRRVVRTNTNLGMILLLTPLACAAPEVALEGGIAKVLGSLTVDDARLTYEAIRRARPGGLGEVSTHDVACEPDISLREAMCLASDRDLIAAQYATGYRDVFGRALPKLLDSIERGRGLALSIVATHIELLAAIGDTLIARKRGREVAAEASRRARALLASGWPDAAESRARCAEFDEWLREDGHARNPGATADLVAAALYAGLREELIDLARIPWNEREG